MVQFRFSIYRFSAFIFFLFPLLAHIFVCGQEYTDYVSYHVSIPIKPLSERGIAYFEKTKWRMKRAQSGCNVFSPEQNGYTSEINGNVTIGMQHGTCTATTTCGQYTVTGGIDILSIISVIPALFEALCRLIDINKKYYKQNKREYLETILYEVDKKRCDIYVGSGDDYDARQKDVQYLHAKLHELQMMIATCGTKKCARCDARYEAQERIEKSLRFIESQQSAFHTRNTIPVKKENAQELQNHQYIQCTFTKNLPALETTMHDSVLYAVHVPLMQPYVQQRSTVLQEIVSGNVKTGNVKTYAIQQETAALLTSTGVSPDLFTQCYGNPYQYCLHQEAIALLEHVGKGSAHTIAYQHRYTVTHFVEVACEYNQAGECYKAVPILDFCWTLLSWGRQIICGAAEGAICGVINAAIDTITHPIETGISMVLGNGVMLTYQLSKIIYTVADLSITAIINPTAGKEKWESYLEPINQLLDAIDRKKIGLKEASKAATQFGVQWYTQVKLLGCLRTFYDGIKASVVAYMSKDAAPELDQYLATPDSQLCKAAIDTVEQPIHNCPASCINQYEKLKEFLTIEQFTSIIKTTKHGIQRLIERKFTPDEVRSLYNTPDIIRLQKDGAKVFIKKTFNSRCNLMIINQQTKKVITALRNACFDDIEDMGNNYGWSLKND